MANKTKFEWRLDPQIRKTKQQKEAFIKWMNSNPEFKDRRPKVEEIIRECRRENSPLRILFEQDVQQAAVQYWESQAQYYLRHINLVRIEIKTGKVIDTGVRYYIPPPRGSNGRLEPGEYIPAKRVANMPAVKREVVQRAYDDIMAWKNRYQHYSEFFQVFEDVIKVLDSLQVDFEDAGRQKAISA